MVEEQVVDPPKMSMYGQPKKKFKILKREVKKVVSVPRLPSSTESPCSLATQVPRPSEEIPSMQKEGASSKRKEGESSDEMFVMQPMITCLGNKRSLVDEIYKIAQQVGVRLKKTQSNMVIMDGFSGSSVVGRKLSSLARKVYANDMEHYAYLSGVCSLCTPSAEDQAAVASHIAKMNALAKSGPYVSGIVTEHYAPKNTEHIEQGERCFYTHENAMIIDTLREYIRDNVHIALQPYCLMPLITKASIHANTSGVFKGFHSENGVGKWGGAAARCLPRIKGEITLDVPVWSSHEFESMVFCGDINKVLAENIEDGELDLLYLDPPYNQHPYGSNYFMLNLIGDLRIDTLDSSKLSKVSGIVNDWKRSDYNYKDKAIKGMRELLEVGLRKSRYVLISYNDEGIISDADWAELFEPYIVETHEIKYNAYRGSRNLAGRSDKVMERMYLVAQSE